MGLRPRLALVCTLALGCAHSDRDRAWVTRSLKEHGAPTGAGDAGATSSHSALSDGLDEDEAAAMALRLNPTFQAELARIDAARADLAEAGRLPNPQLTLVGGLGPISSFATLLAPLDALWQMPRRTEMAARALEAVAESLVQTGLSLARDARVAHADRGLAEDRARVRAELAGTWAELARLGDVRAKLGETNAGEAAALRAEAAIAADTRDASDNERILARAQLRNVLGLDPNAPRFDIRFTRLLAPPPSPAELIALARASRPDLRAAELSVRSAVARAGWERSRVVSFAAQVEGHWTRPDELASRVGGRVELPIFQANPGGIGRANAEVARSVALLNATRQRVLLEILQAHARIVQGKASLETYRTEVLPPLEEAARVSMRNYELGEETHMVVLDGLRRQGEARLREAELLAAWRRADAELERAVGARIGARR